MLGIPNIVACTFTSTVLGTTFAPWSATSSFLRFILGGTFLGFALAVQLCEWVWWLGFLLE